MVPDLPSMNRYPACMMLSRAAKGPLHTARTVKIAGIGKHLPGAVITSASLEHRLGLPSGWIERKTGVRERRHVVPGETQSRMGAAAGRAAIADAGAAPGDVDLIICASGGQEQPVPCTAALIQRELGLAEAGVPGFDVNSTCLSFVQGLDVAAHYVAGGGYRAVLVIATEAPSTAIDWNEHESAVLLGDGAAAVLVTPATGASLMYQAAFTLDARGAALAEVRAGGTAHPAHHPDTTAAMTRFRMQGPRIFRYAQKQSVPFIARYAAGLPFPLESLGALCAHQASVTALRLTARACGFRAEQVLENIATHGNCVAASIPMVLHDGVRAGRIRRGDRVLLAGTAAGTAVGALALVF
jgi:3-oxoacyl-[acyl-carrier-protein] synthase-3